MLTPAACSPLAAGAPRVQPPRHPPQQRQRIRGAGIHSVWGQEGQVAAAAVPPLVDQDRLYWAPRCHGCRVDELLRERRQLPRAACHAMQHSDDCRILGCGGAVQGRAAQPLAGEQGGGPHCRRAAAAGVDVAAEPGGSRWLDLFSATMR